MDQNPAPFYEAQLVEEINYYFDQEGNKCINEYIVKDKIGQGSFGKVKRVTRRYVEQIGNEVQYADYAMKDQRTCYYEDNGKIPRITNNLEFAYNEINVWKYLDHPNIAKLYQIIDDPSDQKDCMYIITQLGDIGSIMNYIDDKFVRNQNVIKQIQKMFNVTEIEQVASKIFKQVALGIKYLHQELIVNRDIKVDNIVCSSLYPQDECIKLIDFSTAKQLNGEGDKLYDCAGTSGFRAPEQQFCLEEGYQAFPCDIWSFGISLFTFINEDMPFWADSELEIDLIAKNKPIKFQEWNSVGLRDLINRCCSKDPNQRPKIYEILENQWMNQ